MRMISGPVFALFLVAATAGAAHAQVCVEIDTPRDTLDPQDRAAALLLLTRQFTLAGEEVVASCPTPYLVAHVKLGNTITVTITGPKGTREGTALGLDDLPALYSQMVRSLETGRPMTGLGVVDRTNVTAAQASAQRVHSDGFTYARLGYSGIFGDRVYGTPAFGFGYRAELDSMAIDVSFFNTQMGSSNYYSSGATAGSLLKLSGLYLVNRESNATPYFGGGLSWGHTNVSASQSFAVTTPGLPNGPPAYYTSSGHGSGLQGELTAGYELGRATTIRLFVQADAILPFYSVTTDTFSTRGGVTSSSHRYVPSLVMSVGLGWGRNRK